MGVRFGFELETVGRSADELLPEFQAAGLKATLDGYVKSRPQTAWALTYDGSLPGWNHAEVVSPIDPPWRDTRKVIDLLKTAGCRTSGKCGLHVHVSDDSAPQLRIKLPRITVRKGRAQYCLDAQSSSCFGQRSYAGVYQVADNHLEVRLFNGKIDYHYLLWAVGLVKRSLVYPKPTLRKVKNTWSRKLV